MSEAADVDRFVKDFETAIWEKLPAEAKGAAKNFRSLTRIEALRNLLRWYGPDDDVPDYAGATDYMSLGGCKGRPVLPTPAEVMRLAPPRPLPRVVGSEPSRTEELIAEAVVVAIKDKHLVIELEDKGLFDLSFDQLPRPVTYKWDAERLHWVGSVMRVKLQQTPRGKLRVTAKGIPQKR
jgi:hypothetical protein